MGDYQVALSRAAERDLDDIIDYIAEQDPVRALSFGTDLLNRLFLLLRTTPRAGRRYKNLRVFIMGNYVSIYEVRESDRVVLIHMITHASRHWVSVLQERLEE